LAGVAALVVAFLTVIEIVSFIIFPPPNTIDGWFILFQSNPIIGVLDIWGLEFLMYVMFSIVFLALYFAVRNVNKSAMVIALTSAFLGIAVFFATNNPFSMFSLSNQFAAAATEAHRSALLAAGEAILVNTNQRAVGGFNLGLFLVSIAGLITSSVMIRASSFSRFTACLGILAFGMSLADYLRQVFTSAVLTALLVIVPGALLLVLWFVLVGIKLSRLGRL
jgi:hypothetical protein